MSSDKLEWQMYMATVFVNENQLQIISQILSEREKAHKPTKRHTC
jgi:hypothetical protein